MQGGEANHLTQEVGVGGLLQQVSQVHVGAVIVGSVVRVDVRNQTLLLHHAPGARSASHKSQSSSALSQVSSAYISLHVGVATFPNMQQCSKRKGNCHA
jgi:hypothetical protein